MEAKDVKELRTMLGKTQQELADTIGVDVQTVQAWEQKRKKPSRLARRALKALRAAAWRALNARVAADGGK